MWSERKGIVERLVDRYSDVLDVHVQGEPEDFLLWTGLNVIESYGSPSLEPDIEHRCVAILILEGVVHAAPTTNWDGLVEAAVESLAADPAQALNVVVRAEDFQTTGSRVELLKFHGCAVRASADQAEYRSRLIARKSQISGWTTKPENTMMKQRLEHLFASRPAFIIGLSAQDADIHTVLQQATQNLARSWPSSPPAVVFAEQSLHYHHRHVMKVTYGDSYNANADDIHSSALLGAYAKPTLLGLVLYVLANKLEVLVGYDPQLSIPAADEDGLREAIHQLRNEIGSQADANPRPLLDLLVSTVAVVLSVFRFGRSPEQSTVYQPLSSAPMSKSVQDPDYPAAAFSRLAVLVALLGRGLTEKSWSIETGHAATLADGAIRMAKGGRQTRAFVVRDARVLSELEVTSGVDLHDPDVLVVVAESALAAPARSPHTRYGRTGSSDARVVDLESICASVTTADELFEAFTLESDLS